MLPRDAQCLLAIDLSATAIDALMSVLHRSRLASATLSIALGNTTAMRVEVVAPADVDAAAGEAITDMLGAVEGVAAVEVYTLHRHARADRRGSMFGRRLVTAWHRPTAARPQRRAA